MAGKSVFQVADVASANGKIAVISKTDVLEWLSGITLPSAKIIA